MYIIAFYWTEILKIDKMKVCVSSVLLNIKTSAFKTLLSSFF